MSAILKPLDSPRKNVKVKKKKYSHTGLSMAESCLRQYFYKYIQGRPYPSNPPMQIGKIFHSAIELMIREGYSSAEALYYSIGVNGGLPEGEKAHYLIPVLNRAYERLPNHEFVEISSEMHLEVKTTKGIIHGYVDVIIDDPSSDITEIWDFKTGWHPFSAETNTQLPLYGWLFKQIRGYVGSTFKGKLVFPRLDSESDSEVELTDAKLTEARNWLVRQINRIESKDPTRMEDWSMANDRSKCEYCPYAALCAGELLGRLPSTGEAKSFEEAQAIGEYILAQETALKKMKDGLKKYVSKNDKVPIGSGAWMFEESSPKPKCEDVGQLIDFAKRNNLDVKEVLNAKPETLQKWLDKDETGELNQLISFTNPRKTFKYVY